MTTQEHALMITMFAAQLETVHTLTDVLKSRGILQEDDLHAFWTIRPAEIKARARTVQQAHRAYAVTAQQMGIDTSQLPPMQ